MSTAFGHVLLDTSVVLLLPAVRALPRDPERASISAVTLAELSVGPLVASDAAERERRQLDLQQAEANFDPLPLDARTARMFGTVAAAMRRGGRKSQSRSFDALIAATALAHDLPLYTANPSDFEGIPGLTVVEVLVPR